MSEWSSMSLRDAGVKLIDCVHKTPVAREVGFPYVTIPQMKGGRIDFLTARKISEEDYVEWTKKAKPQRHDVVLSRRTNPGVTATFGENTEFALGQNLVLLRADGRKVLPEFLRWLVVGPAWWEQVSKYTNVGAVFDSLRCADVPRFELPVPPLADQRRIAAVLGSLDDKIELNRRMAKTLEAMAQALFQDWFVDFGPVRRRVEGASDPVTIMGGLAPDTVRAAELAALFPKEFDGEGLPLGWGVAPFLEVAKLLSGGTPKTSREDYWNGGIPWASAGDVSQCSDAFLIATERSISMRGLQESSTKMIPKHATVVVARGATTGRFCMFGEDLAMNQTCYALVSRTNHPFWLNCAFRVLVADLVQSAHGSVFDTITTATFERAETIGAPAEATRAFEKLASQLFLRVLSLVRENSTLAETRDYLLPRLISGEVRAGKVEALAAA
jgi:type I restriction enzyme, S subunit